MSPTSFEGLERRERRRLARRSGLRILAGTAALILLYALVPIPGESGAGALGGLIAGLLVFLAGLAWQVRAIIDADHPELRAAEALGIAVPLLIVAFAFTYLSLSHADRASFSGPLNHIGALYFTVSVVGTVGFGDIVARTNAARLIVTIQILLDIGMFVGIARTVVLAARIGVRRQQERQLPENSGGS